MRRVFVYRYQAPPEPSLAGLLVRFAINGAGLFLASEFVPGIEIGDWQSLLAGTAIFAIVNMLLRPIALFLSCCLVVATFGVFVLVVNAAMLIAAAWASAFAAESTVSPPNAGASSATVMFSWTIESRTSLCALRPSRAM